MKIYAVVLIAIFAFMSAGVEASTLPTKSPSQVVSKTKHYSHKTKYQTKHYAHKSKYETKHYAHKTKNGSKKAYSYTAAKTRPARHKTWHAGEKVVQKTKKIVS